MQVCTFYQRGLCSYGSRCRYEHVKLSRPVSNNPLPPLPRPSVVAHNSSPDTSRAEESSSNTHTQSARNSQKARLVWVPDFGKKIMKRMLKRLKCQRPTTPVRSQSARLQLLAYALGVITARRFMVTCAQRVGSIVCIPFFHQNVITTGSSVNVTRRSLRLFARAKKLNAVSVWSGCFQSQQLLSGNLD